MKRFSKIEEVVKFEQGRQEEFISNDWISREDAEEWLVNFEYQLKKLWSTRKIVSMMVFETDGEWEDEEYGLFCSEGNEEVYQMVYMSQQCNDVRFVVFDRKGSL